MKKALKIVGGLLGAICLVILLFASWYVYQFYPRQADAFEVGNPQAIQKFLIATQGSEFKAGVVQRLIALHEDRDVFLRIIDVSTLPSITPDQWSGIVILNTSIADNIDSDVKRFLSRAGKSESILLITTSGGGDYIPPDLQVDGITTASRLSQTETLAKRIFQKWNTTTY